MDGQEAASIPQDGELIAHWVSIEGDDLRVKWTGTPDELREFYTTSNIATFTDAEWGGLMASNPDMYAPRNMIFPPEAKEGEAVPVTVIDPQDPTFQALVRSEQTQKAARAFMEKFEQDQHNAALKAAGEQPPMLAMSVIFRDPERGNCAAIVTKVNSATSVNLFIVFDGGGFYNYLNAEKHAPVGEASWCYPWEVGAE